MHIHKLINYEISEYYTRGPAKLKKRRENIAWCVHNQGLGTRESKICGCGTGLEYSQSRAPGSVETPLAHSESIEE